MQKSLEYPPPSNSTRSRRIQNELKKRWLHPQTGPAYEDDKSCYYFNSTEYELIFYMLFKRCAVKITLDFAGKCYPFDPPDVYIGDNRYCYREILVPKTKHADKLIDKCPCCSTIVCMNHWKPVYGFHKILDEIRETLNLKIRLVELEHCYKITKKYFGFYIPIDDFI